MVNTRGNLNVISVSLDDNSLHTVDNIVALKKECDRALGVEPSVGTREYITRYGRTQVIEEIINRGAPEIVKEYREILAKVSKSGMSSTTNLINPDESLKKKVFDLSSKGWNPI